MMPSPTVDLPAVLAQQLAATLPGREAQRRFEPDLGYGRHFGPPPPDARRAAVVVLVYPHEGRWHVPLTVRPPELSAHGGQISLPGGQIEPNESPADAALRELFEELAVPPAEVTPLGPLTPLYIFGTRFWVEPWLAACRQPPAFVPNRAEVAELLTPPVETLCDAATWGRHARTVRGLRAEVPHIALGEHRVWGATAMILGELITLVADAARTASSAAEELHR